MIGWKKWRRRRRTQKALGRKLTRYEKAVCDLDPLHWDPLVSPRTASFDRVLTEQEARKLYDAGPPSEREA